MNKNMHKGALGAFGAAVMAATLLATPASAVERDATTPANDGVEVVFNGLEVDAQSYAEEFSVTPEEALQRLQIQDRIGPLTAELEAQVGTRFAGVYINHQPTFELVVRVAGPEPLAGLTDIVAGIDPLGLFSGNSGLPVRVEYGAENSEQKLIDAIEAIDWDSVSPDIQGIFPDVKTGEVNVEVLANGSARSALPDQIASHPELDGIPTKVTFTETPSGSANRGGLMLSDVNGYQCTSAFTVRNTTTGVTGVSTAGHCPQALNYHPWATLTQTPMDLQAQALQFNADLQWHSIRNQPAEPYFHATPTDVRPQRASGVNFVGQYLCTYGLTTGYGCGTTTSTSYTPAYAGACGVQACSPVFSLINHGILPGDSGGPWFAGETPHGITMGYTGTGSSFFTRAAYLPATMGVEIIEF